MKDISPFSDQMIITLTQGYGFQSYGGEISGLFSEAKEKAVSEALKAGRFTHQHTPDVGDFLILIPKDGHLTGMKGFKGR